MSRVWFWRPCWYWHGWRTLLPVYFGGDECGRRTVLLGWTVTGRVIVAVSRPGRLYPPDPELSNYGCCALEDGHNGVCAWKCSGCGGTGRCVDCGGTGGPDDVVHCESCEGNGACPEGCFEGWVTDDR